MVLRHDIFNNSQTYVKEQSSKISLAKSHRLLNFKFGLVNLFVCIKALDMPEFSNVVYTRLDI